MSSAWFCTHNQNLLGNNNRTSLLSGVTLLGDNLVCNAIQITLANGAQFAATLGVLLDETGMFESLECLAGSTVGGTAEVRWVHTVALATTIDFGDGANASWTAVVQVTQNRSATHIEPVGIVGGQLLEFGCLDDVHLVGHLQLASPKQQKIQTNQIVRLCAVRAL